jgi:hypothetical protein
MMLKYDRVFDAVRQHPVHRAEAEARITRVRPSNASPAATSIEAPGSGVVLWPLVTSKVGP